MLSPAEHKRLRQYIQDMDVTRLAMAFDALSEPKRCLIFRALLKEQQVSVGQLANVVGISDSLASQHLKILREAGLVDKQKAGKTVYYAVCVEDPLVLALQKVVDA